VPKSSHKQQREQKSHCATTTTVKHFLYIDIETSADDIFKLKSVKYLSSGEIVLTDTCKLDYETLPVYSIQVNVSDGQLSDVRYLTVYISDVNEQPTIANMTNNLTLSEDFSGLVLVVNSTDPEEDALYYSLVVSPKTTPSPFVIDNTGEHIG